MANSVDPDQMLHSLFAKAYLCQYKGLQDKIFRRKRQSTGTNFVHVYIEIWDKGILKFNKFSM